ncbi:hypothetical protein MIMGU_mgv1a015147mg [Erythranthe guttata]|uniref:Uncharacterized protein n=1 Tax=Erythranthe guttata TaxID=4155 RepID=A0A022R051_ERYGU|nr:hypothetical protein MIMGU_mgv1a015147mg [Erythranthe guttata]
MDTGLGAHKRYGPIFSLLWVQFLDPAKDPYQITPKIHAPPLNFTISLRGCYQPATAPPPATCRTVDVELRERSPLIGYKRCTPDTLSTQTVAILNTLLLYTCPPNTHKHALDCRRKVSEKMVSVRAKRAKMAAEAAAAAAEAEQQKAVAMAKVRELQDELQKVVLL